MLRPHARFHKLAVDRIIIGYQDVHGTFSC
jgi:hypothetical protein